MIVSLLIDKKYEIENTEKTSFIVRKHTQSVNLSGVVQHLKLKICFVYSLILGLLFSV